MAVDITPTQDGGVLKEILTPGEGEDFPPAGSKVKAHYHGTLTDGTVFDSSVERNSPFEFTLGQGQVIKAWDLGVATMKKGEKARLTCRANYAYGDNGSPPKIPAGATLIFDITLLSWQEEDLSKNKDGGILRAILKAGQGHYNPAEFRLCKVHLKGSHEGRIFDERDVSFIIGEGAELGIPSGIEDALTSMKQGEVARLTLSARHGWPDGNAQFNIPPNATIKYEIQLDSFEKDKEAWDMDAEDKIAEATLLKTKATEYLQKGVFSTAEKLYGKAASYIEKGDGFNEAEEIERKKILLALRLNLALAHLKLNEQHEAKIACDEALLIDPNNVKGLFRRGQAHLNMSEPELAKEDLERVLQLEPSNSAAKSLLASCKKKIADMKAKEKQIYANMFEKFATKDKESYHYGWWDDQQKHPVVSEILVVPEEKDAAEKRKRDKKKQLEHLKRVAEKKRKEREEEQATLGNVNPEEEGVARKVAEEGNNKNESKLEDSKIEEEGLVSNSESPGMEEPRQQEIQQNEQRVLDMMPKLPNAMAGALGEWTADERQGEEMTDFERENPDVFLVNKSGLDFNKRPEKSSLDNGV